MATQLQERPQPVKSEGNLEPFLAELGNVCRRYGFGLTDGATVFILELEDYGREFSTSDDSELHFV